MSENFHSTLVESPPNPEQHTNLPPHLYWLSGATGTQQSGVTMIPELERAVSSFNPNPDNRSDDQRPREPQVTYLHSIFSSQKTETRPDSPENRFTHYAAEIASRLEKRQPTAIVMHSFGVQEFSILLQKLEENHLKAFEENIDMLTIILIGPYGIVEKPSEGRRQKFSELLKLLRFVEVARAQMPLGPINSFRFGLESLAYLPPATIDEDVLNKTISALYANSAQQKNLTQTEAGAIPAFRTIRKNEGFFASLPQDRQDAIRKKVAFIDTRIANAIKKQKLSRCKWWLRVRGHRLYKEMTEAYKGGIEIPEQTILETYQTMAQAQLGLAELYDQVMTGRVFSQLQALNTPNEHGKKAAVTAIIPEFDVIYSIEELQKLLQVPKEDVLSSIALLEATTHNSLALNAAGLREAVVELFVRRIQRISNKQQ